MEHPVAFDNLHVAQCAIKLSKQEGRVCQARARDVFSSQIALSWPRCPGSGESASAALQAVRSTVRLASELLARLAVEEQWCLSLKKVSKARVLCMTRSRSIPFRVVLVSAMIPY